MTYPTSLASLLRHARLAGLLYLVIIVTAGLSEGFIRAGVMVPGNPVATADNIVGAPTLFRWGLVGDLIAFLCDTAVAVLLYGLLRHVDRTLSLLAMAFRLLAHPAIAAVNLLNHWAAALLLGDTDHLAAFSPEQLDALALFALELHGFGYLIGGAFFGVHCILLGYLLLRSPLFPAVLGGLLALAGLAYLGESFAHFAFPAAGDAASSVVVVAAGVGEVSLCLWLLIGPLRGRAPSVPSVAGAAPHQRGVG